MMLGRSLVLPALALTLAAPAPAQDVGEPVSYDLPIEGFSFDPDARFEEYTGRALLLEYFAYW